MPIDPPSNENTYILDAESGAEMARLINQDRLITEGMGGLLPEQYDTSGLHDILDIACGPGGWVCEMAFGNPGIQVVGIDISSTMVEYARATAWSQRLDNASFRIMDVLKPLDFPDNSFDLVNARFLVGFIPKTAWPKLLEECMRITRPGGVIRLTEFDEPATTNSAAFAHWMGLTFRAIQLAGLCTSPDGHNFGITPLLRRFLLDAGCQNIGQKTHMIDFSQGMPAYESMYTNCEIAFLQVQSLMIKKGVATPEEIEQSYRQMLLEMRSNDFCALWYYLTAWGQKPG
jgi:ubiquinone/menaquinone biosynthesis C-methylase UbiE